METPDVEAKLRTYPNRLHTLHEKLLPLARAAANQMKDAGMHRGSDPLLAVLFEIDALESEMAEIIREHPCEFLEALRRTIPGGKR